jgi:hypothetical protein
MGENIEYGGKALFMADIVIFSAFILDVIFIEFIYCIIGEMHVFVVEVLL